MKLTRIVTILSTLFVLQAPLMAQEPELSADQPISYTSDNGILIATGNAVFQDENTRVEADEIRYNRNGNRIEASGNVRVTREGLRLLTHNLVYDAGTRTVTAGRFRAGYPPLFIEGDSFSGTLDDIDFSKVSVYFREPVDNSPRLEVAEGTYLAEESIKGSGLRLNVFGGLKLPLPRFEYAFGAPTADIDASLGFRNNLGVYLQTHTLYPLSRRTSIGGNLDFYSNRGVLVGPAMVWRSTDGTLEISADTGWIHDRDDNERGFDSLGQAIDEERGFAEASVRYNRDGHLQAQLRTTYVTDSEIYRDFRRNDYFEHFQPDSFVDFTWQDAHLLVNAFARRQLNGHYGMVERLPEVRAEWLPSAVGETGWYLQAAAGVVRYRQIEVEGLTIPVLFPDAPLGLPSGAADWSDEASLVQHPYHNRLDGSFTLTRPLAGPFGTQVVLRAGGRRTEYRRTSTGNQPSLAIGRWAGELGVDLSKTVARSYSVNRPDWNLRQIKHISRLSLQYRWHPGGGDATDDIPPIDQYSYLARRPVLDLADIGHTDGMRDWNLLRLGWENRLMAAGEDGAFRDYLSLNFFQDLDFSAEPGHDQWDALYSELDYSPFPWLKLQWRQKVRTERRSNEAAYLRATLSSADIWSMTFQAEYLKGGIEQYDLTADYRLTEDLGLLGYWHYDAKLGTLTRQQYGISRRFANVWRVDLYVAFNDENDREDDFSVGMRVLWLSY